jgi:hypothetical protein
VATAIVLFAFELCFGKIIRIEKETVKIKRDKNSKLVIKIVNI